MNISLCTYSRNRLEQVIEYFNFACEVLTDTDEIVYIDYGDPMRSGNYVSRLSKPNINAYRVDEARYWNMNHARNCAGVRATKDILFFCDIDVYITEEIVQYIRNEVNENTYVWGGFKSGLTVGSCAMTKQMYQKVNGYEEMFSGWGWDDACMYHMLGVNGYKSKLLPESTDKNHIRRDVHRREHNAQERGPFNKKLLDLIKGEGLRQCNYQRTIGIGCKPINHRGE